eukprot:scaffold74096_cov40-Prasinocladus_malaysianus.AAC.1
MLQQCEFYVCSICWLPAARSLYHDDSTGVLAWGVGTGDADWRRDYRPTEGTAVEPCQVATWTTFGVSFRLSRDTELVENVKKK